MEKTTSAYSDLILNCIENDLYLSGCFYLLEGLFSILKPIFQIAISLPAID